MTNRIQYSDNYIEPTTKAEEVMWIADLLRKARRPLTLENAQITLGLGLDNAPEAWKLTMAELPALWAALVEQQEVTA